MKRKQLIARIVIVILVLLIITSIIFPSSKAVTNNFSGLDIIGELKNGDVLEEEFTSKSNYNKIGIPFANYGMVIDKGKVEVTIENSKGKKKKYNIKLSSIVDNQYYYLTYKLKKNQKYKITVMVVKPEYPITIYMTKKDKKSITKFNGDLCDDNIRLGFMYNEDDYFNIWNYVFILSLVILYSVLIKNSGEKNEKK